ncbi:MAG: heat-inducible transcriptional repressor HrcA [Anaerolineae bacterium]|nr:heat-inducible transcriptional repressor HrcA [Anaerolineae bacterium]
MLRYWQGYDEHLNVHLSLTMNIDDTQLPELTRRQEEILSLIIRAYTRSPEPVSSIQLVETNELNVSSATIRNEMAVLEKLGYIAAPHTSAGRVPTEIGYRYFVKRLLNVSDLTGAEQTRIAEKFQGSPLVTEQWMRLAASILARTSHTAALVTPPIAETSKFKHLELIAIQGRLVLMVMVVSGGAVHQQMLTLTDPVPQTQLSDVASRINNLCQDLNANEVRMKGVQLQMLEREVADLAAELMDKADSNQVRLIYRDGLSDVIGAFQNSQNSEGAQQAVRVFEERAFLNMILSEMLTPIINNVQVVIGGEGRWEELKHLSMVLSRYGIPGQVSGAVGVLGPMHINYGRAISTVRYVSSLMTDALVHLYESDDKPAAGDKS